MAGERLSAMGIIAAGVGADLQGLASDATVRADLDRAAALRAAIPEIAMHLSAVDQIHRDLGLTPLSLEFLSGLVSAESPSDDSTTRIGTDDVPAAILGTDRKEREHLEERYFEAVIARTKDGELVVQTWDELLRFVYPDEFSRPDFGTPRDIQDLTDEIKSIIDPFLGKLPGILTTHEISDQILRIKAIVDRYSRFYKGRPVEYIVASVGREFLPARVTTEPDDDANQGLIITDKLGNG